MSSSLFAGLLLFAPCAVHADIILVGAPVENGSSSWDTQFNVPPSGTVFDFADQSSLSSDQFVTDIRVPLFGATGFLSTDFNLSLLASPPATNPVPLFSFDLNLPDASVLYSLPINSILTAGTYYLRLTTGGFVGWPVADPSSFVTTYGTVADGIWELNTGTGVWTFIDNTIFSGSDPGVFTVNGPSNRGSNGVPEPGTLVLVGMGIVVAAMARRRARS